MSKKYTTFARKYNTIMKRVILLFLPLLLIACRVQQPAAGERFMQDVRNDIPFAVTALLEVPNHDGTYAFRCDDRIDLLPDYELDAEGVLMAYRTTFAPSHDTQPANVIWRNIVINRKAHRVLCIDRLVQNGKTFGYVYVLQSETRQYSNAYHWDVTDHRMMLCVAASFDYMSSLSVSQLQLMIR